MYIKLIEGGIFVDFRFFENYIGVKNVGLRVGFYYYVYCINSLEKEVVFFIV